MATFYRVVSAAEYEDILATKLLRAGPNSMEGKHLWERIEDARLFAEFLLERKWETECILIQIQVADAAAARFDALEPLDGIGRAWFAKFDDLREVTVSRISL